MTETLNDTRQTLTRLRDEIKVQLHLGSLELKEVWKGLEAQFVEAERAFDQATDASAAAAKELVKRFEDFRVRLKVFHKP